MLFLFDSPGLVFGPVVSDGDASGVEHGDCSGLFPTHAGSVQAVLDDVPARAFDHSAGDGVARSQVLIVTQTVPVVAEIRDG